MQPWRAILLLAAITDATPQQQRQHQPLHKVLLVLTVARRDRFYLTRRYERFFGGVAYVIWPQPGCGRVYHGRAGPRQVPCAPLNATDCDAHGLGCLLDRAGAEHRTPTYARLFEDLAEADGADVFSPRKEWLRKAWRHTRAPSGVLVAHMDFWLQPLAFQRRVARGVVYGVALMASVGHPRRLRKACSPRTRSGRSPPASTRRRPGLRRSPNTCASTAKGV